MSPGVTDITEAKQLEADLKAALEQQTATAVILAVISSSPGDLKPVFDMMLANAMRLCDATCSGLFTYDGSDFHTVATKGVPAALADYRAMNPPSANRARIAPMLRTGAPCHVLDIAATDSYKQGDRDEITMVDLGGARSCLGVVLRKDGALLGGILVYRQEVRPYTSEQIASVESFAAQAVIAMENARLLGELQDRTQALSERNTEFSKQIE